MISFIIPTYRNKHSLEKCLISIQDAVLEIKVQEYEILLIDNNTGEDRIEADRFRQDLYLKIHPNPVSGAHASRRLGVQVAMGKTLIFVDDDNYLQPDYLKYISVLAQEVKGDYFIGCANKSYLPIDWESLQLESQNFACGSLDGTQFKQNIPVYWGAGVAMNKELAIKIYMNPLIVDGRKYEKKIIFSGEDHEIALRAYFYKAFTSYFKGIGLYHHIKEERLTAAYYNKLMLGFELAAWNLRIYYWINQGSFFSKTLTHYFLGNLFYSFFYIVLHPFKISAQRIFKEAFQFSKVKTRYSLVMKVLCTK